MNDSFLEVLEAVRADQASTQALFGDAGTGVRHAGLRDSARYQSALAEAAQLLGDVMAGRRPDYVLREAMSTSDFPLLFGDIMDRAVLAAYREYPVTWPNYARARTVRDFRTVNLFDISGAAGVLSKVPELTEYPQAGLAETRYQLAVAKYGRGMEFSWESLINDDLGAFSDVPAMLGGAARATEEYTVAQQFAGASGPLASVYSADNANIVTGNPALSIAGLQTAMGVLGAQTDADGNPISLEAVELVVVPALQITAMNIVNATEIRALTDGGGTSAQTLVAQNWMRGRLRVSVNPYITTLATSANGTTSWFLFASPAARPAVVGARLRGHEEPEIFMRESNQRRVGGAGLNPLDGDFDTDAVGYKVRHAFGAGMADPKATVASNGSGS